VEVARLQVEVEAAVAAAATSEAAHRLEEEARARAMSVGRQVSVALCVCQPQGAWGLAPRAICALLCCLRSAFMFPRLGLNVAWISPECSLNVLSMFSQFFRNAH
jgi:hypothetical protein